jgi:ferric-dicitrate binding protein FerR (iron transport regulator)
METSQTYFNDLIIRYFCGEASEQEMTALWNWMDENEENHKIFDDYRKTWEVIEVQSIEKNIDLDLQWNEISSACFDAHKDKEGKTIQVDFRRRSNKLWLRIAAVIAAVVFVSATLIYLYWDGDKKVQVLAENTKLEQVLPDGSQVTLAPGAKLSYPKKFKNETREVNLQGDAYFDVAHNADKPFIIHAGEQIEVKVLGTQFYVNTSTEDGKVQVILISGKVAVYYKSHPETQTILLPGEKAELAPTYSEVKKEVNNDINFLSWKTGRIDFNNEPLDKVVKMLRTYYRADIRLADPALAKCTITSTFEDQSLDAVLRVIKETLSLEIKKQGKVIIISGPDCQ